MSHNRMARACALAIALAASLASASSAQTSDRDRVVAIARKLQAAPLDPALRDEREWAVAWLVDTPDISVNLCAYSLDILDRENYPYASQLLFSYMLSMGALQIARPETASDLQAQQLAGVEAILRGYRAIGQEHPESKSPPIEALLAKQADGSLPAFVEDARRDC